MVYAAVTIVTKSRSCKIKTSSITLTTKDTSQVNMKLSAVNESLSPLRTLKDLTRLLVK